MTDADADVDEQMERALAEIHAEPAEPAPAPAAPSTALPPASGLVGRDDGGKVVYVARAVPLAGIGRQPRPPVRVIPTGLPELDRLLGGGLWSRRVMTVVGAPAAGKTAWAVDRMLAIEALGTPGLYVSTELETDELHARFSSPLVGVPWREILRSEGHRRRANDAVARRRIHVLGCERLPSAEDARRDKLPLDQAIVRAIFLEADTVTRYYGVGPLVCVDYLQQVARAATGDPRAAVGAVSQMLRECSQRADVPILAVGTVSRAFYGGPALEQLRATNSPRDWMRAAKESGDVEYDSAQVAVLDVLPVEPGAQWRTGQLVLAKSRFGEEGFVGMRLDGALGRWESHPEALAAMRSEARAEERAERRGEEDEARVLGAVQAHPGRAWRDLRALARCGRVTDADRARDRLRARGAIREEARPYHDSVGRQQTRPVWVAVSEPTQPDGPAVVEMPPIDPNAIASRYLVRPTA